MAKQASRMMIGGFVVLAVIIMVASLVVFGSGRFFKKTVKCVLYFNESVSGLNVGAPVLFQGVQIGSVVSVTLEVDPTMLQLQIPIVIEYEPEKFHVKLRRPGSYQRSPKNYTEAHRKGAAGPTGYAEFYYRTVSDRDWFLSRVSHLLSSSKSR